MQRSKLIRCYMDPAGTPPGHTVDRVDDGPILQALLVAKLHEEAEEVRSARTQLELTAELADAFEVLRALAQLHKVPWDQVVATANAKALAIGGFLTPAGSGTLLACE